MIAALPTTSNEPRNRTLAAISEQLERLMVRVADDVARYADAKVGPAGGGFVIYYLTDESGEPLKTTTLVITESAWRTFRGPVASTACAATARS